MAFQIASMCVCCMSVVHYTTLSPTQISQESAAHHPSSTNKPPVMSPHLPNILCLQKLFLWCCNQAHILGHNKLNVNLLTKQGKNIFFLVII